MSRPFEAVVYPQTEVDERKGKGRAAVLASGQVEGELKVRSFEGA
jgi:hypothetical protein